jgi:hypothetical protein
MNAVQTLERLKQHPLEGYERALAHYQGTVKKLQGGDTMTMPHDELEKILALEGQEAMRLLMQAHLDQRAARQSTEPVVGADGVPRAEVRELPRNLETRFGTVVVNRVGLAAPKVKSVVEMDAQLNLPARKYSHGLCEMVARGAAGQPFSAVVESIGRHTGGKVPKRQAEQLAQEAAVDFEAFYRDRQRSALQEAAGDVLVISLDSAGMPVIRKARRDPEVETVPNQGLLTRRRPGQKPGHSRMAGVVAVYTAKRHVRSAEVVLGEEKAPWPDASMGPKNKMVRASVEQGMAYLTERVFEDALMRDRKGMDWVVVVDGNLHQIDEALKCARRHNKKVTIIVDVWHVSGYLWEAAHGFHPTDEAARKSWVRDHLHALLTGSHPAHVAAGIRRSATLQKLPKSARKAVDACCDYLLSKQDYLRYSEYLAKGFPIGSGLIEGTARHLVKDRMDIAGAHWNLVTAEAVLRLRSLEHNGDFDEYWKYHVAQEAERNHGSGKPAPEPVLAQIIPMKNPRS